MLPDHQESGPNAYCDSKQDQRGFTRPEDTPEGRYAAIINGSGCIGNGMKEAHWFVRRIFRKRKSIRMAAPAIMIRPSELMVSMNAPRSISRIAPPATKSSFD
jgi:hypothetical protein